MGQTPSVPQPGTKIQVIGAGLSRTGTASFSAALAILLDGPIYHGGTQTTIGPPEEIKSWITIMRNLQNERPDDRQKALTLMERRLDGYAAITDAPGTQLVPELLELYPDAKVICTVRDPVAWEKSMAQVKDLVRLWFLRVVFLPLPGMRHFVDYITLTSIQWRKVYGTHGRPGPAYHKHIAWLKEIVPEDRLVFVDVKDGWEPLCKALGKEVPKDIPFPRINDSEAINRTAKQHIRRGLMRWAGIFVAVGVVSAAYILRR
ncbi:NAD dependent epimerase/dehydratase [Aspergillus sclerotiicarbonarius CBS 121057]|uniref:NAD dependent epimerase/dehydratase n=1 Tax=Aspergillus sclerotiicarbonarius (strain CBS 121057 / IBT 28362) TaxID=1448318 RepID=A0A319DTZ8_ASPSB|nr:NAD dependent epimerase/dehydratase [Aspergillus sclerotiicarbonarius CBS 121057]